MNFVLVHLVSQQVISRCFLQKISVTICFLFLANSILEKIDNTIDPCEDFYHFACGSWIKNARIKHKRESLFSIIELQLNSTYIS